MGTPPSRLVPAPRGGVVSSWPLSLTPNPNPTLALSSDSRGLGSLSSTSSWPQPDLQSLGPAPNCPQPLHHHHHLLQGDFPACPERGLASPQPSTAPGPPVLSSMVSPKSSSSWGLQAWQPGGARGSQAQAPGSTGRPGHSRCAQSRQRFPPGPAQDAGAHIFCNPVLGCEWRIC